MSTSKSSSDAGKSTGQKAERRACHHLEKHGLHLKEANFCCKLGEIDLIMWDQDTLVFVEVRYRSSAIYGSPLESVTPTKQKKIKASARYYLQKHRLDEHYPVRFDIVAITANELQWVKHAF